MRMFHATCKFEVLRLVTYVANTKINKLKEKNKTKQNKTKKEIFMGIIYLNLIVA